MMAEYLLYPVKVLNCLDLFVPKLKFGNAIFEALIQSPWQAGA